MALRSSTLWLEITTKDVGALSVVLAGTTVMEFGHGEARFVDPEPYLQSLQLVALALPGDQGDKLAAAGLLLRMAALVDRTRHGGAVLVAADPQAELIDRLAASRVVVDGPDLLGDAIREMDAAKSDSRIDNPQWQAIVHERLRNALAQMARLSNIDGALLLDLSLRAVAFGVMIEVEDNPKVILVDSYDLTAGQEVKENS